MKSKLGILQKPIGISALVALMMALMVSAATADQHQAAGNLPAGTSIEVSIDDPVSGTEYIVQPGDTATVDVSGSASVGEGAVVKDTTVAYVLDVSGSMAAISAGVDCTGDAINDSRLVCQEEAIVLTNQAAADPSSVVGLSGVASYATTGAANDVDLGTGGTQLLVSPDFDGNSNGTPDIEDVVSGLASGGATCYSCGLNAALSILNDASNTSAVNNVIFTSDGENNQGVDVNTLAGSFPAGTTIHAFAIGGGVSCSSDPFALGSMDEVAALTTGGTCTEVTDISELADVIDEAIGSSLDSLEISVNGGSATTIGNDDIDPDLPQAGPASVDYSTELSGLAPGDHEICVTANGTDAGGTGDVTACVTIRVIVEAQFDVHPTSCPNPINLNRGGVVPVAIVGTDDFDVSLIDPSTVTLEGVSPDRSSLEDVVAPYTGGISDPADQNDCTTEGPDGITDLALKFDARDLAAALGAVSEGDVVVVTIEGELTDGSPFQGQDVVWIR